jgi:hypothetical protein
MKKPSRVSVLIVGASHRDPAPVWLLRQAIQKMYTSGIAIVSCAELPCDQTHQRKQALDKLNAEFCSNLMRYKNILQLQQKDERHLKPYFLAEQLPAIETCLQPILGNQAKNVVRYLLNYPAIVESIEYDKCVEKLKIPYQGLEREEKVDQGVDLNIRNIAGFFQSIESTRIEHMTQKICVDALLKTGGKDAIIICSVGSLHAQRLAASVIHYSRTHTLDCDLQVLPMMVYSNYTDDTVEGFKQEIQAMQAKDPSHFQALYQTFATPIVNISEKPDGEFVSYTFGHILALAKLHVLPDKVHLSDALRQQIEVELKAADLGFKPSRSCL